MAEDELTADDIEHETDRDWPEGDCMCLLDYERLSIRRQNMVNYESIQSIVIPTLDDIETVLCMILEILGDDFGDDEDHE